MNPSRKFIPNNKIGKRARLKHVKNITEKETKCMVRVIEARTLQPLKTPEIKSLIRMEGPTGVKLKKTGIIGPLMEGPTGMPILIKNRVHARKVNISYGKRGVKKTESRKIY